jgi:hypothetical protein
VTPSPDREGGSDGDDAPAARTRPPVRTASSRIRPYLAAGSAAPVGGESEPSSGTPPPGVDVAPTGPRPFVLTSGRVDVAVSLVGLETQVTARTPPDGAPPLGPPHADIVAIAAAPIAVAEISAKLRLHLGVAKILVADLHADGRLDIHDVRTTDAPDPELIMRVIRGIRDIT